MNPKRTLLALSWAFLLVLSLLAVPKIIEAGHLGEPSTTWAAVYGGRSNTGANGVTLSDANAIAIAPNGDIIIVGNTFGFGAGGSDFWVLRLNGNGDIIWQKTFGGSDDDYANAVAIAPNGDIIVAGDTSSFGNGGWDTLVIRLDGRGNVKWEKTYGGEDNEYTNAVAIAPNGDIITAGSTSSFGAGNADIWVMRLSPSGDVKWQMTYGGPKDDEAYGVALTPGGNIVVSGYTESFGAGDWDAGILRLSGNGDVIWQKTYGGKKSDEANAVAIAGNGDIIVAGDTSSFGAGDSDVWVLQLDGGGNVKWAKAYGGKKDDYANAVALTPNGDMIVAGSTYSFGVGGKDLWVLKLDSDGNVEWEKTYGEKHDDTANGVTVAPNGDILIAGGTYKITSGAEAWVIRLGENGGSKIEHPPFKCGVDTEAKVSDVKAVVKESRAQVSSSETLAGTPKVVVSPSNAKAVYLPSCEPTTVTSTASGTTASSSSPASSITTAPIHLPSVSSSESPGPSSSSPPSGSTTKKGRGICGPAALIGLSIVPLFLCRKRR
ncbi:CGP-CTERM sorting domain-containing protein [Thermococcus sp.]